MKKTPNNWVEQLNDLDTIPESMIFNAAQNWNKIESNIAPKKNNSIKNIWRIAACLIFISLVWFIVKDNFYKNQTVGRADETVIPVATYTFHRSKKFIVNQKKITPLSKIGNPKSTLSKTELNSIVNTPSHDSIISKPTELINETAVIKLPIIETVKPATTLVKPKKIPIIHLNDLNYELTAPVFVDAKRKGSIYSLNDSQQESINTELQSDIPLNNNTLSPLRLFKPKPKPVIISFTENQ